jgi:hypothetical protein
MTKVENVPVEEQDGVCQLPAASIARTIQLAYLSVTGVHLVVYMISIIWQ